MKMTGGTTLFVKQIITLEVIGHPQLIWRAPPMDLGSAVIDIGDKGDRWGGWTLINLEPPPIGLCHNPNNMGINRFR